MSETINRINLSAVFKIAAPVAIADLGWIGMSITDTMMVGRVSVDAIGAVSLGSSIYLPIAIFGMGLLLGLDTLVSYAFGAGNKEACRRWLARGIQLSLAVAPLLCLIFFAVSGIVEFWDKEPAFKAQTLSYMRILTLSIPPLLLYGAFRRYLQGMTRVYPVMAALIIANLVNILINWILIFGNLGAPALGVSGAAWATVISRTFMALFLLAAIVSDRDNSARQLIRELFRINWEDYRIVLRLGFPAALQLLLEVGVFATVTVFASWLDVTSLAAHHIVLNIASFTFMVPQGISSAAAVIVGKSLGAGDYIQARIDGWTTLGLGISFMSCAALAFLVLPDKILHMFTIDPVVTALGIKLLAVAALFQIFDGCQVVSIGLLRGLGNTRTPMLSSLFVLWGVALPTSYILCFVIDYGVIGLWIGLCAGLMLVALWLIFKWHTSIKALELKISEMHRFPE
jgi:MATE family, multidrug efflux pump